MTRSLHHLFSLTYRLLRNVLWRNQNNQVGFVFVTVSVIYTYLLKELKIMPLLSFIYSNLSTVVSNSSRLNQPKVPKPEEDPLWGSIAAPAPKNASKSSDIKPSTSHNDDDDLWGSIAAPPPKSAGKPLKPPPAANSDDLWGAIAAPPPSTKARPLASSGRGRGTKPAQPKLGAQRIGRTSSTGM